MDAPASGVRTQEEALSKEQLCLRRLHHLQELQDLYKAELWGTLEEMRARYRHFKAPDVAGTANGSPSFQSLQTLLGKRKAHGGPVVSTDQPEAPEVGHQTPETSDVDVVMIEAQASPSEQASGPSRHVDGQDAAKNGSIAISAGAEGDAQTNGQAAKAGAPPTFSEAEDFVLAGDGAAVDAEAFGLLRRETRARLSRIARLEQAASASTARQLDRAGALAMLTGRRVRFLIKRSAFTIGRPTSSHGAVDVDLGREGDASRVSRLQARLALRPDGAFTVTNCGRRKLHVNGCQVERGQSALMQHLSLLEVGGIRLLLHINHSAVKRLLARSASFGDFPGS
ncbi:hypothetical protein WJX75_004568 [Coccomyxa subellipsoidea]|uniref:FHA domain-containing protein n=1 Tax=Coccomyxa subellipsoidea TaxID=248742 RepID=A0ABR2YMV7_9CHLO